MYACGFQFYQPHASQETAKNTQRMAMDAATFIVLSECVADIIASRGAYLYA